MTLKMTSVQGVETSVNVSNNSYFQNYTNSDDHTKNTTDTPGANHLQRIALLNTDSSIQSIMANMNKYRLISSVLEMYKK